MRPSPEVNRRPVSVVLLVVLAVTIATVASSCATPPAPTIVTEPGADVVPAEPARYSLALALNAGETYAMTTQVEQVVTQEFLGVTLEMIQSMSTTYFVDVLEVRENGTMMLEMRYEIGALEISANGPAEAQESLDESFAELNELMETMSSALEALRFELDVEPNGTVTRITGLDDYRDLMRELMPPGDPQMQEQMDELMGGLLDDEYIRSSWGLMFGYIPFEPVAVGESWTRVAALDQGFAMNVENTYTLAAVSDGTATVSVDGVVTGADGEPMLGMELPGFALSITLGGVQTGEITSSVESGWIVSQEFVLEAEGEMTLTETGSDEPTFRGQISSVATTSVR